MSERANNNESRGEPSLLPKSLLDEEADEIFQRLNDLLSQGALIGVAMWLVLTLLVFLLAPPESYEQSEGLERNAYLLAIIILCVSNGSKLLPLLWWDERAAVARNGFLRASTSVQITAVISNFVLFYYPTPVLVDPYSGLRFHLVRWAEFTPLAFLMTCLTCNLDAPLRIEDNLTSRFALEFTYPTLLAISTFCGMIFPLCDTAMCWWITMTVAWVCFTAIYIMVFQKRKSFLSWRQATKEQRGAVEKGLLWEEKFLLARNTYHLSLACAITWTALAAIFSWICLASRLDASAWWNHPAAPVVCMVIFEVFSKILYLRCVMETYESVLNEGSRMARRMEEMRHFLVTVWSSSSDVIVYILQQPDLISARISPAFYKMLGCDDRNQGDIISLVLEINPTTQSFWVFDLDLNKPVSKRDAWEALSAKNFELYPKSTSSKRTLQELNIVAIAQLIWDELQTDSISNNHIKKFQKANARNGCDAIPCEVKTTRLEGNKHVLVLRDISDRLERFEAEKKLVFESTSRQKDAETNKFTRHEVKNGILSAIGLLDHLKYSMESGKLFPKSINRAADTSDSPMLLGSTSNHSMESTAGQETSQVDCEQEIGISLAEVDSTLRDILDTILDDAMAKEIIHGDYRPKTDATSSTDILSSLSVSSGLAASATRFSIEFQPDPFPLVSLDRHLVRYIYRNAISNACRYGKQDGNVSTTIEFDLVESTFTMKVVNLPGEGHKHLVQMTEEEVNEVFAPGKRLSAHHAGDDQGTTLFVNNSSGNGAWIMQKCAQCLGGSCSIAFLEAKTEFTFKFQASGRTLSSKDSKGAIKTQEFSLPEGTWGIVIDDSRIQRKLMNRFLKLAGIDSSRRIVLGANDTEVFGFADQVKHLIESHRNDHFLVIADENLDIDSEGHHQQTVSGSLCVQQLLFSLQPDDEKRVLTLIRSANDSALDLELYHSRAHGVLLKEPIQKNGVLDLIKPFWTNRFLSQPGDMMTNSYHEDMVDMDSSCSGQSVEYGPIADDIKDSLRVLGALCTVGDEVKLQRRWHAVRERLHALKGDLMSMVKKEDLSHVLNEIDALLLHGELPDGFLHDWESVTVQINAVLQ